MPPEEKVWTVIDIIKWGTGYLTEKGFDEARLTVELLLAATLGVKRFDLYVKHDQPLKKNELDKFKMLLKRRLAHEPVQYIIGKTNFYSIEMKIDRRALIPRPETEILAEAIIEHCRTYLSQRDVVKVLDVGTGSGCIAIAVAKFVRNSVVTAIDASSDALDLAKENAAATGTRDKITFAQVDFLGLETNPFGAGFDILVSNPPYVSEPEMASLPEDIRQFEPVKALSDGRDGLTFFRKISEAAPVLLRDGGWVFVETGYGQARNVEKLFSDKGATELLVKKDLSNIDRVVRSRFFLMGRVEE
ncbi:MAG: peptide chain release factor N(5)-glutamine methyltransferase [Bacteroidetes bacterium]|nr:peptide chain release factor N(5)-glutamine methyltransferase [Bacteroidota bacterium]